MTIAALIAAFGGGVFGALIGALAAFIFTGLLALIGIAIILAGGSDTVLNQLAFGPLFGPHIAFAGGVAASAYLGRKKNKELKKAGLPSGTDVQQVYEHKDEGQSVDKNLISKLVDGEDITTPLFQAKDSVSLIIAGLFGVAGYILNYLFAEIWALPMDTVAFAVLILALAARFIFGNSGLTGHFPKDEPRYAAIKENILFSIIWGASISAVTAYVVLATGIDTLGFAISAASLIFLYFDLPFPITHHVTITAGYAALTFGNIWVPMIFGALAVITGELTHQTINTHVDTHIDMPATMIAFWSIIILGIFG